MKLKQHAPINILLADDDTDDCIFFKEALDEFLFPTQLTAVHDGERLMQLLTNETNEIPHVLFLDLNMPRKDGFECLAEIKVDKRLKQIPVIIFTTSFHKKIADMLYEKGAHYLIQKPSAFSRLKKVIEQSLTLISQNLPDEQADTIAQPAKENFVLTVENRLFTEF